MWVACSRGGDRGVLRSSPIKKMQDHLLKSEHASSEIQE
jgi:hypothetical protein